MINIGRVSFVSLSVAKVKIGTKGFHDIYIHIYKYAQKNIIRPLCAAKKREKKYKRITNTQQRQSEYDGKRKIKKEKKKFFFP